jgi:CyaY protein
MSETQFLQTVEETLAQVETAIETARIAAETSQTALILTIEFDDGARIIINAQTPMRQLWLASRGGAMHFAHDGGQWKDTRSGIEFFTALSQAVSAALGSPVELQPPPAR